jgi:hypothetical protein
MHGVVMFQGGEVSMMTPTKNLTMEKNKRNLGRMWMWNINQMNIVRHKSLILSDVETPMMKNFKHAYVFET